MAAVDQYNYEDSTLNAPANDVFAITPNDSADLPFVTRFIRANVAGTVKVTTRSNSAGAAVTLNFAAGETRAVRVSRVWATGTTATGLEGMV